MDQHSASDEVIKEELVLGKREVVESGIRVTSTTVEGPVQDQVSLREERVTIDHRPTNRPMTRVMADAFRERTLAATAQSEEAVIAKDVRVVEEIGLRKSATRSSSASVRDQPVHTASSPDEEEKSEAALLEFMATMDRRIDAAERQINRVLEHQARLAQ